MRRVPISSWTLFIITTLGLILLLVAERPELQGPEGQPGRARIVRILGHTLAWGAAAVLTVRMVRSQRGASSPAAGQMDPPHHPPTKPIT
jgi:hypothetical protein